MDTGTVIIVVVVIFAILVLAGFFLFRKRSEVDIDTPVGKLSMKGSNESPPAQEAAKQPAVVVEDVESRSGGVLAEDKTGGGVSVKKAKVEQDIIASSETPDKESDPKA